MRGILRTIGFIIIHKISPSPSLPKRGILGSMTVMILYFCISLKIFDDNFALIIDHFELVMAS
ncbi:MAG: hypothetical protein CO148_05060 [Nitrospirae bacterium CG_4_9_14_3_um_filter_41_27]|nr:MAG: hypothetical protein AUK38_01270 [Nitrospirae bacterium CG2_30_41_42]PJA80016.1 MAG: hypothetical protein CO148_05060 [Nitrospirae bacterium CG_4_9_14_3_um_filter_41_27]